MAALASDPDNPSTQFCGGSLINIKWVVTAAHCVENKTAESVVVLLGIHDLLSDTEYSPFTVDRIVRHPFYDSVTQDNDIALLQLTGAATAFGSIPMVTGSDTLEGKTATIIGWGLTADAYPDKLQQVEMPIISNSTCSQAFESQGLQITENMLCAGFSEGGKDACDGDSGGPLMVKDGTTKTDIASDTATHPVNASISGLSPNTTFHFRISATNSHGMRNGEDKTFSTAPMSDVDGDGSMALSDAIITLQVIVGMQPQGLRADYTTSGADANGDGKAGMAEVLYIMQSLAGLR